MGVIDILKNYQTQLWQGAWVTIQMCLIVYPIGIVFGSIIGIVRHHWRFFAGVPGFMFSLIISSTPFLVLLFWLHYPLQYMLQIVIDPFYTSIFALSIIMITIVADQVKNTLGDFPIQYLLAAKACGLTFKQTIFHVQLPIIFRQILPHLLFAMVVVLQMSLFASMIGVNELFKVAQSINSDIYRPVEIYSALALFFIGICSILNLLAFWLKFKLKWTFSEN